jgi:hypothetical protein
MSSSKKKILWGSVTWIFFHTLAEKINNNFFIHNKKEVLNLIEKICVNLPCPTCANHAIQYISNTNSRKINSKQDLILFFYNFHNTVNYNSNNPIFKQEDLQIYKRFNMNIALQNFMTIYPKRYNGGLNLTPYSNQLQRRRTVNEVKSWLKKNWNYFN